MRVEVRVRKGARRPLFYVCVCVCVCVCVSLSLFVSLFVSLSVSVCLCLSVSVCVQNRRFDQAILAHVQHRRDVRFE